MPKRAEVEALSASFDSSINGSPTGSQRGKSKVEPRLRDVKDIISYKPPEPVKPELIQPMPSQGKRNYAEIVNEQIHQEIEDRLQGDDTVAEELLM